MTEQRCRWDRETERYLTPDGEECDTPRREHCTARRTCSHHLGWGELTCARCLGRMRQDIRRITDVAPLMMTAALETRRIDSEAAMLAGPAVDPRAWTEYRLAATRHLDHWLRVGRITEGQHEFARDLLDDDEFHPYNVLTRWHMMLAEDYGHDLPARMTITDSAAYLDRNLHTIANDEDQDFRLLAKELRTCRNHLDAALQVREFRQKGAPCPDCRTAGHVAPMVREYGHWCEDRECRKIHYRTDEADRWVCSRNSEHWRSLTDYERWVEERRGA